MGNKLNIMKGLTAFALILTIFVGGSLVDRAWAIPSLQRGNFPDVPLIASYQIAVSLNPDSKQLTGQQTITYHNITTDPIPNLIFHLYLNAFRDVDSYFLNGQASHRGFTWGADDPGFIEVQSLSINDQPLTLELLEDDTLAQATLPQMIEPGETVAIKVTFLAKLPRVFARTGFVGDDFFMVGQWFPKLGVWENGAWNAYPFYANNEFYADFGAYDVSITLPENYVTGGSGVEIEHQSNSDGTKTVRYQAEPVIDFAWAASPHFQTATELVNGTELRYLYLPEHDWTVMRVLEAAKIALETNTHWFGPYPYEQLTLVDVPDGGGGAGGMEYPTLVTIGTFDLPEIAHQSTRLMEVVTIHEVGHQWFQSMVATNEVEAPWLDEGMTDYATALGMMAGYGQSDILESNLLQASSIDLRRAEYLTAPYVPMAGRAFDDLAEGYSIAAYSKPTLALTTLQRVLGDDQMRQIMGSYFRQYRFKHPTSEDFRAVAESVTEQDLDWFFDGLVYGTGVINYRIKAMDAESVTVERQGDLSIPVEILITFADGSTVLETWDGLDGSYTLAYLNQPPIIQAEIDPNRKILVDMRWADNGLAREPLSETWLPVSSRWLYTLQDILLIFGGL